MNENLWVCISNPKKPSLTAEPSCHLNLNPLSKPSAEEVSFANSITGSVKVVVVELTDVVVPATVKFPPTVKLPCVSTVSVLWLPNTTLPFAWKTPVTVKLLPIVTSSGNPTVTFTSVPTLVTAVSISFAVPKTWKSSVRSATSCDPESPSTVKAVATVTVLAAVNRPCWSTVNVGIAVCDP